MLIWTSMDCETKPRVIYTTQSLFPLHTTHIPTTPTVSTAKDKFVERLKEILFLTIF